MKKWNLQAQVVNMNCTADIDRDLYDLSFAGDSKW